MSLLNLNNNINSLNLNFKQNNNKAQNPQTPKLSFVQNDVFVSRTPKEASNKLTFGGFTFDETKNKINEILKSFGKEPTNDVEKDLTKIESIATIDSLSRNYNKRTLFTDLQKTLDKKEPFSVAMFDMDNFKAINELLGYDVGDKFIKIIGGHVKEVTDKYDLRSYRFGGDEFVILFPQSHKLIAKAAANEIKTKINQDEELKKYQEEFNNVGKELVAELKAKQKPLKDISDLYVKYEATMELYNQYANSVVDFEVADCVFFDEKVKEYYSLLTQKTELLIQESLKHAKTKEERKFLNQKLEQLKSIDKSDKWVEFHYNEDKELNDYFNIKYSNRARIAQIEQWLESVNREKDGAPNGYTVTCGIKEFDDYEKPIGEYIKEAGDVLKDGKQNQKGLVYTDFKLSTGERNRIV